METRAKLLDATIQSILEVGYAQTTTRGGVILPVWQAEAMWLNFRNRGPSWDLDFPVAIKVAAGKINAVTGGDITRAAATYLDTSKLATLIVGDHSAIADSLPALGLGEPRVLPLEL